MRDLVSGGLEVREDRWGKGFEPERLQIPLQDALSLISGVED